MCPVVLMGLCFKVNDPEKAILKVEKFNFNNKLAQAFLRCGKVELDTILLKREEMGKH
jgi:hypothetical protein